MSDEQFDFGDAEGAYEEVIGEPFPHIFSELNETKKNSSSGKVVIDQHFKEHGNTQIAFEEKFSFLLNGVLPELEKIWSETEGREVKRSDPINTLPHEFLYAREALYNLRDILQEVPQLRDSDKVWKLLGLALQAGKAEQLLEAYYEGIYRRGTDEGVKKLADSKTKNQFGKGNQVGKKQDWYSRSMARKRFYEYLKTNPRTHKGWQAAFRKEVIPYLIEKKIIRVIPNEKTYGNLPPEDYPRKMSLEFWEYKEEDHALTNTKREKSMISNYIKMIGRELKVKEKTDQTGGVV